MGFSCQSKSGRQPANIFVEPDISHDIFNRTFVKTWVQKLDHCHNTTLNYKLQIMINGGFKSSPVDIFIFPKIIKKFPLFVWKSKVPHNNKKRGSILNFFEQNWFLIFETLWGIFLLLRDKNNWIC